MPRVAKPKKLAQIAATREGSIYGLQFEDEAGKKVLFELTSDQALRLADRLDNLLADEEQEQRPTIPDRQAASKVSGTVKWYNVALERQPHRQHGDGERAGFGRASSAVRSLISRG